MVEQGGKRLLGNGIAHPVVQRRQSRNGDGREPVRFVHCITRLRWLVWLHPHGNWINLDAHFGGLLA